MNKSLLYMLMLAGCSFASLTIPNGECQNFTLFNETDNSTLNQSICAGNATIIYNVTNVTENITYNVTNVTNVTVVQCNATNATIYANSTVTLNNATVTCLTNSTRSVDAGAACTNTTIYVNQTVNQTVYVNNETFCKENVNINPMAFQQVFFSSKCNITIVAPANQTTCPTATACLPYQYYTPCETCKTCEEQTTCPPQRECVRCPDRTNETLLLASLQNETADKSKTIESLNTQLRTKDELLAGHKSLQQTAEAAVKSQTEPINTGIEAMLAAVVGVAAFSIYKSRERRTPQLPKILTEDRIKNLNDRMKPTEGAQ